MNVRPATTDDVERVRRVARRSWEHDYPAFASRETVREGVEEWYSADRLTAALDRPGALVLVAERADEVVGFAHVVWDDEEGDVLRLYVDPDHRRVGVGTGLLEAAVERLLDREVRRVRATVLAANDPGNAFYRAAGFEPLGDTRETTIAGESYEERTYELDR